MNTNWKDGLYEDYRKKFGCKNIGKVCWCEICVNIEMLIKDTIEEVKKHIPD